MARFFFHLFTGDSYDRDEIGSDLKDANEAFLEAFETAQELAVDLIREQRNPTAYRFEVVDAQGRLVFHLPFTEILGHRPNKYELDEAHERRRRVVSELHDEVCVARSELQTLWLAVKGI